MPIPAPSLYSKIWSWIVDAIGREFIFKVITEMAEHGVTPVPIVPLDKIPSLL